MHGTRTFPRRPQGMQASDIPALLEKIDAAVPGATLPEAQEAAAALAELRPAGTATAVALAELMRGGTIPAPWYLHALAERAAQERTEAARAELHAGAPPPPPGPGRPSKPPAAGGRARQEQAFLEAFEARFVFVRDLNRVYDLESGALLELAAVNTGYRAGMPYDDSGRARLRPANVIAESPNLTRVHQITYAPGQERFLREDATGGLDTRYAVPKVNCWRPSDLTPQPGDAAPMLAHVHYLFDAQADLAATFLDYLAFLIQRPGQKVAWAPLVIGNPGIGKDTVSNVMSAILGAHNCAMEIDDATLTGRFREWLLNAQLAVVPELLCGDRKHVMNGLKPLITAPTLRIDQKGVSAFTVPNRVNFIYWSNYEEAAYLDKDDRRFFVYRSRAEARPPAYYRDLYAWIEAGGAAIFARHLLERDLSGFAPHAQPPVTADKQEMARRSRPEAERALAAMLEAGECPFTRDVVRLEELEEVLRDKRLQGGRNVVRRFLKSAGAIELGQKRIDPERPTWKPRIWALRHTDLLKDVPESVIRALYRGPAMDRVDLERLIAEHTP